MSYLPSNEFYLELAKGNVAGHSSVAKFGENDVLVSGVTAAIWDAGGLYVPPTQARIHEVSSDDATDAGLLLSTGTSTGGSMTSIVDSGANFTGDGVQIGDLVIINSPMLIGTVTAVAATELTIGRLIRNPWNGKFDVPAAAGMAYRVARDASTGAAIFAVSGLNSSMLYDDEFVILNGLTPVATSLAYTRQFRARVFCTANDGATGVISSIAQTDGTTSCQIVDGNNQTLMSIYTVPVDKVAYMTQWWGSLSRKKDGFVDIRLRIGFLDSVGYVIQSRTMCVNGSSEFVYEPKVPYAIQGGVDIWVEGASSEIDMGASSGFNLVLTDL